MHETMMVIRGTKQNDNKHETMMVIHQNDNKTTLRETLLGSFIVMMHLDN